MRALVVYDSRFGNTREVAEAIAGELGAELAAAVELVDVPTDDLDLLVVGGPTHAHGVSAPLRTFLDGLPSDALAGVAAASFDTRLHGPRLLTGSASRGIARRLRGLGAHVVGESASFLVAGGEGPLDDGELDAARRWASRLTSRLRPTLPTA